MKNYVKLFENFTEEVDYDEVLAIARERGYGDLPSGRFQDFEDSSFYDDGMDTIEYTEAFVKYMNDMSLGNDEY